MLTSLLLPPIANSLPLFSPLSSLPIGRNAFHFALFPSTILPPSLSMGLYEGGDCEIFFRAFPQALSTSSPFKKRSNTGGVVYALFFFSFFPFSLLSHLSLSSQSTSGFKATPAC